MQRSPESAGRPHAHTLTFAWPPVQLELWVVTALLAIMGAEPDKDAYLACALTMENPTQKGKRSARSVRQKHKEKHWFVGIIK